MISNSTLYLLIAVFLIVTGFMLYRRLKSVIPYAYPNARIRAREGNLIDKSKYQELTNSRSLEELASSMEEAGYKVPDEKNSSTLERSLDSEMINTYSMLGEILPEEVSSVFRLLRSEWDIKNLLTIIKTRKAGEKVELDDLTREGELKERHEEILESEDLVEALKGTRYEDPIREYELEDKNMLELENKLYKDYFDRLMREAENNVRMKSYFGRKIDIKNISFILRSKIEDTDKSDIKANLIDAGTLNESSLTDMVQAENFDTAISKLEDTKYFEIISEAEGDGLDLVGNIERNLLKRNIELGEEVSYQDPMGVGPTVSFISKKEAEIRNLKAIVTGIKNDLNSDLIIDYLVGVKN